MRCLLTAYVESSKPKAPPKPPKEKEDDKPKNPPAVDIPETVRPRFATFAKRLKIDQAVLAGLFDFHQDPFTFHAVAVPGNTNAKKTRNVALLLGAKTYLSTGKWTADWQEFRAMCVDQNCYDRNNVQANLNSKEGYFKTVTETGITLSSAGITAAEAAITSITSSTVENDGNE